MKESCMGATIILRFLIANFTFLYMRYLGRFTSLLLLALALPLAMALPAFGQAPGLAWTNNVGARVFAVDALQNVYATANGSVIILNSAGAIIQSNAICPLPAIAQRDASGNYYFLGSFVGTQDFGGTTLNGGSLPTCFLAKYDKNGGLQWATSFGIQGVGNTPGDLVVNLDGSLTFGYMTPQVSYLDMYSSSGNEVWQAVLPLSQNSMYAVKLSPLSGTNGTFLEFSLQWGSIVGGFYDPDGRTAVLTPNYVFDGIYWVSGLATNAKPVKGTNNDLFMTSYASGNIATLSRWKGESVEWSENIGSVEQLGLAGDTNGDIYLAGTDGSLSKYNIAGTLLWKGNYGSPTVSMIFDAQGNRYISGNDGSVGKLLPDSGAASPPVITITPQGSGFTPQGFCFSLLGNPQAVYEIFTSTNLSSWQSAGSVTNASGLCQFTDPSATNTPSKFYRAVLTQ